MDSFAKFLLILIILLLHNSVDAQWEFRGFVTPGASKESIIKAGDDGLPYVAYVDETNGNRLYVKKYDSDDSWNLLGNGAVSSGAVANLSFSVDGNTPYVFFRDSTNSNRPRVMTYTGSSWVNLGTQPLSNGKCYSNDILAKDGVVYVYYNDANFNEKVFVKKYENGTWTQLGPNGLFTNGMEGFGGNLGVSATGQVYLAVPNTLTSPYRLCMVQYDESSNAWSYVGPFAITLNAINNPLMDVAADGTPYIAFGDPDENNFLKVIYFDGNNWELLNNMPVTNSSTSLSDFEINNGIPYTYYGTGGTVAVSSYENGNWSLVGGTGFAMPWGYSNFAFSDNAVFICYQDYFEDQRTLVQNYCFSSPNIQAAPSESRCGPGTFTLTATATNGSLNWYDSDMDGNLLATGAFTTPVLNNTTTYYVQANDNGCTSGFTAVTATINPLPDAGTSLSGLTLTANQANANYQWYNCGTTQPIVGATMQSFTPTETGNYQVTVSLGDCSTSSSCTNVEVPSAVNGVGGQPFSLYPNPSTGIFKLDFPSKFIPIKISVYNSTGQLVKMQTAEFSTLDLRQLPNGLYFVNVGTADKEIRTSVVKGF